MLHTRKNQKEKNSVFFLESSFGQQQSAHKKQRDRPKRFFQSLSRFLRVSFLLSLGENWGTTLSLYIHIIHTHTTQIINESVLSNERARARHGEWKTREPSIGVANYSSSGHRGAIIIILFFFERDRYGKE